MRFIRFWTLLGAALLLQACLPPATTHPVGTTTGLRNDPALTGLWRGKLADGDNDERDVYFHFLPKLDSSITVVLVQAGSKPDGDWMVVSATTSVIQTSHFLNATLTHTENKSDDGDVTPNSFPMLYRYDGPHRLTLYFLDEDAVKDAIKSGVIRGTVTPGAMGDATVTADAKTLDAFMASKRGLVLFSKPYATLTKME
jgi:hypothetical protein